MLALSGCMAQSAGAQGGVARITLTPNIPGFPQILGGTNHTVEVQVKTLIIWGSEDKIIPVSHAAALTQRAETHILPGAGHMVHIEKAAQVNEILLQV